jgi:hypothetical protein
VKVAVCTRPPRRDAISGRWSGHGKDTYVETEKELYDFDLVLTFTVTGKTVRGFGDLTYQKTKVAMECEGGFLTGDYMQLFYRSRDRTRKQMGVIVFRLDLEGTTVSGGCRTCQPHCGRFRPRFEHEGSSIRHAACSIPTFSLSQFRFEVQLMTTMVTVRAYASPTLVLLAMD